MAKVSNPTPTKAIAIPVPADAVRVWRGFKRAELTSGDFLSVLGSVFIPVTAQLQSLYGLTAYLPTVLPTSKPSEVPDEIALVFYKTQQAYNDTKLIIAGRAYSWLHKSVFAFPASLSDFPIPLGSTLALDQPYHLFSGAADWRTGYAHVFSGARPKNVEVKEFAAGLQRFFQQLQKKPPAGLDGAVCCVSTNYVVYWEHWTSEDASLKGRISELPKLADRVLLQKHVATPVESSLTAHDAGLSDVESKSFNIIFQR